MANSNASLTPGIFKAYDIRGVLGKTLDIRIARQIGQAFGSAALIKGEKTVVIGRDGRLSGPSLSAALAEGLQSAGVDVIDVGMVATPMLYFATYALGAPSGIMVTGSHNPPDYNGFKMVLLARQSMARPYSDCISAFLPMIFRADKADIASTTFARPTLRASSATSSWRNR